MAGPLPSIEDIVEAFEFIDDWEDRYRYVIELGRMLPALADEARTADHLVPGCVSQVWLVSHVENGTAGSPVLRFEGDSDALIVKGLVAILLALYSGRTADEIRTINADDLFRRLGLREHLTPQRSNGLTAMVRRVQTEAGLAAVA